MERYCIDKHVLNSHRNCEAPSIGFMTRSCLLIDDCFICTIVTLLCDCTSYMMTENLRQLSRMLERVATKGGIINRYIHLGDVRSLGAPSRLKNA